VSSGVTVLNACCQAAETRGTSTRPSPSGIMVAARMPSVE
jgi:hypothetical protein